MLTDDELEQKIHKNEKSMQELTIRMESHDREITAFLQELNVLPEQLTALISTKEQFSEENWKELNKQKQELDEKLNRELKNIRNPLSTKKAYKERQIGNHWLFVR